MTTGVYVVSCRLASEPLWLGIYPFLWWFLLVIFVLFLLHWRYELPCQDKLPEFHCTPILGCIRVLWLVFHPLGLRLDKTLCGWNSVTVDGSFSLSSEISSNCLNCSLKWRTNCSVVPLKLSSRTVLVTYWVSLLFSEAPLEDVLICLLSSFRQIEHQC